MKAIAIVCALAATAHAEVTKCSMFPGTAMMYWLGVRELWRIQHAEESARKSSFNVKQYHDELLSFGSMPVALVSWLMAAQRPQAPGPKPQAR